MAQTSRAKRTAIPDQEDRITGLPDGALQHILGFLPAAEAVQTCMVARRWRHMWKSTRRLHITSPGSFVNPLLLLRDRSSTLDEVKFECDGRFADDIDIWIRHALLCQARVLVFHCNDDAELTLKGPPLVSSHLRRLELTGIDLVGNFLDFASCPALEVLDITDCNIYFERILSQSVKLLRIKDSYFAYKARCRISVPSLISLQLDYSGAKAPLLETMPSLQTAFVKSFASKWEDDYCGKGDSGESCGICASCCSDDDHKGRSVLLGGLSNAMNLELISFTGTFIFKRDLMWCPTFIKLKTLLLNEWCVAIDLRALVCILEHSPVLEKLTLQLS